MAWIVALLAVAGMLAFLGAAAVALDRSSCAICRQRARRHGDVAPFADRTNRRPSIGRAGRLLRGLRHRTLDGAENTAPLAGLTLKSNRYRLSGWQSPNGTGHIRMEAAVVRRCAGFQERPVGGSACPQHNVPGT